MIRRKARTYRKKLHLLTDRQLVSSIKFAQQLRVFGPCAFFTRPGNLA